tara:strand:+ start:4723 stop:5985 length:1263 start_codon:yes stop_codon:yes gene_type:complete
MGNPRKRKLGGAFARLHKKFYSSSVVGGTEATKTEQALTATQIANGQEYLLDLLMLSDHMYDGPKRPFTNGDKILLDDLKGRVSSWESTSTKMEAGDGLLSGLSDTDIAEAATATITTTGNPGNDETFTLTDAAGTAVTFVFKTGVSTVDGTKDGSNVIIGVSGATGSAAAVGDRIRAAITASDAAITPTETSSGGMTLTQQAAGSSGNTAVDMSGVATTTATNFVGGVAAVAAAGTHALHFLDERASTTKGGGTVITDDTGLLFDPAGPAVKYHQDFNGVSRGGTAAYLTIKPESWASGKAINLMLYGALADGDSMRVWQLNGTTLTAITGMSAATGSASTAQTAGTIDMKASLDYASAGADGIIVEWIVPANTDNESAARLPFSGSLKDDGSTLADNEELGSTGLGFVLSWNVSSDST